MEESDAESEAKLEKLIRQAIAGDQEACGELYKRQQKWMLPVARRHLRDKPYLHCDEEDLVQEAWARALAALKDFKQESPLIAKFCGWQASILTNHVLDLARRRETSLTKLEHDTLNDPQASGPTPSRQADAVLVFAFLAQCVSELGKDAETAVNLYYYEKLCVNSVATKMGISNEAVGGLLKRGRARLKDMMGRSSLYNLPPVRKTLPSKTPGRE